MKDESANPATPESAGGQPAADCSAADPAYCDEPGHILVRLGNVQHGMTTDEAVEHIKWCLRALADACEPNPQNTGISCRREQATKEDKRQ